jgi:hypothetical protein
LRYVSAWVVWASIVRSSAPSVIGTLRGFADSATGIQEGEGQSLAVAQGDGLELAIGAV